MSLNISPGGGDNKIDNETTLGLLGTSNSLAYRVHEIEKHFHSEEHWYGTDGDGSGSTANNLSEWTLTAGTSSAYGAAVQLLAANDVSNADFSFTPVKFDLHRLMISVSSANDKNYMIQFWNDDPDATGENVTLITEVPYRTGSNLAEVAPIPLQMSRQPVGNEIWARVKCETNSATLQFTVGIHAYVG